MWKQTIKTIYVYFYSSEFIFSHKKIKFTMKLKPFLFRFFCISRSFCQVSNLFYFKHSVYIYISYFMIGSIRYRLYHMLMCYTSCQKVCSLNIWIVEMCRLEYKSDEIFKCVRRVLYRCIQMTQEYWVFYTPRDSFC